jgi:mevalonate pyrophosphate decarboxylase
MGLAVTDLKEEVRSETTIEVSPEKGGASFLLEGKPLDDEKRMADITKVFEQFKRAAKKDTGLKIESINYNIFSGSSDSGAAALVFALNELFASNLPKEKLAELGNTISESAMRSLYGGLNKYVVSEGKPYGLQLASEEDLREIRIFAFCFEYKARVSAEEIFNICKASPYWEIRLKRVPFWVKNIEEGLKNKDWQRVFSNAEENCTNAHYLIENGGRRCRKKEMMDVCIDVEEIRASGLSAYWTAGGGRVINVFSWGEDSKKVLEELERRGHTPIEYKVASGPKIIFKE